MPLNSSPDPYRRTQRGTLILVVTLLPMAGVVMLLATQGAGPAVWSIPVLVSLLVLTFSWMTVTVDDEVVRVKFGLGPGGRTVPLSAIRNAKVDQLPGLSTIGIRWLGGRDWLYNVSWGPVVRLVLDDGRQVLIGSPEPEALLAAIDARRTVDNHADRHAHVASMPVRDRSLLLAPVIMVVVFAIVGVLFYSGSQPSTIALDSTTFTVSGGGYTSRTVLREITSVTLADQPPKMDARTGGFAFNGHRRGSFTSSEIGRGMIFTDRGHAPYLLVRTTSSWVLLTTPSADSTRGLATRLAQLKGM